MVETIREFLLRGEKEKRFLISDVANHGCSGGTISELIYYDDTAKFHDKHEDEIWDELITMSEDFGNSQLELIASFNFSRILPVKSDLYISSISSVYESSFDIGLQKNKFLFEDDTFAILIRQKPYAEKGKLELNLPICLLYTSPSPRD